MYYFKNNFRQVDGAMLRPSRVGLFTPAWRDIISWKNYSGVLNFVITRFARKQNWHV